MSNYHDPNEAGISEDERGQRLHRFLRDEAGREDHITDKEWHDFIPKYGSAKTIEAFDEALDRHVALFASNIPPTPKGTGRKFTPRKKKRK
jgi:hypothetical protein